MGGSVKNQQPVSIKLHAKYPIDYPDRSVSVGVGTGVDVCVCVCVCMQERMREVFHDQ